MDSASTPLADYFWIAGVESIAYDDGLNLQQPNEDTVADTIAEDGEGEETDALVRSDSRATARHSHQSSANRLSTLSKFSISPSISGDGRIAEDADGNGNTTSNRSSATIRPLAAPNINGGTTNGSNGTTVNNGTNGINGGGIGAAAFLNPLGLGFVGPDGFPPDFDFDKALLKFAAERENFLDDLTFSAGAKTQARPPMVKPRTEKLKVAEEADQSGRMSPLMRSIKGSIRRKMSFRDMTSARKQPIAPRSGTYHPHHPFRPAVLAVDHWACDIRIYAWLTFDLQRPFELQSVSATTIPSYRPLNLSTQTLICTHSKGGSSLSCLIGTRSGMPLWMSWRGEASSRTMSPCLPSPTISRSFRRTTVHAPPGTGSL